MARNLGQLLHFEESVVISMGPNDEHGIPDTDLRNLDLLGEEIHGNNRVEETVV